MIFDSIGISRILELIRDDDFPDFAVCICLDIHGFIFLRREEVE